MDYKGHMQYLQIQCSGELGGIINRFWQHRLLQNLLEKSKKGVVCFQIHLWPLNLITVSFVVQKPYDKSAFPMVNNSGSYRM